MAKTNVQLNFVFPTSSVHRIGDMAAEIRSVLFKHKATDYHVQYSGPQSLTDDEAKQNGTGSERDRSVGRAGDRDEADARAREDHEDATADEAGDAPAEPAKRGRGRPRKSDGAAEAPRAPAGRPDEGQRAEGTRGREGNRRDERVGADEGAGQGRGEGEGRTRGAGADRGAERRDPEQARVKPAADEWDEPEAPAAPKAKGKALSREELEEHYAREPDDEEWPDKLMPEGELDKAMMGEILSQHFEQSGDRAKTLAMLKDVTGEGALANVHSDDYDKAARALLKDAARIKYGVKR